VRKKLFYKKPSLVRKEEEIERTKNRGRKRLYNKKIYFKPR
jgi:ribosomal protein S21